MFTIVNCAWLARDEGKSLGLIALDQHVDVDLGLLLAALYFHQSLPARGAELLTDRFDIRDRVGKVLREGEAPHIDSRETLDHLFCGGVLRLARIEKASWRDAEARDRA